MGHGYLVTEYKGLCRIESDMCCGRNSSAYGCAVSPNVATELSDLCVQRKLLPDDVRGTI